MVALFLVNAGIGLGLGVLAALRGYFKNLPDEQAFDFTKALPTIIIGGIVGFVAGLNSITYDAAATTLAGYGVTELVNALWIFISKYFKKEPKKPSK